MLVSHGHLAVTSGGHVDAIELLCRLVSFDMSNGCYVYYIPDERWLLALTASMTTKWWMQCPPVGVWVMLDARLLCALL